MGGGSLHEREGKGGGWRGIARCKRSDRGMGKGDSLGKRYGLNTEEGGSVKQEGRSLEKPTGIILLPI